MYDLLKQRIMQDLNSDWNEKLENILQEHLKTGKPISKMTNQKGFWKDVFFTNEYVLDPRPETEMLVEEIIQNHNNISILDLGTGSGCILASILKEISITQAFAIDISTQAILVAKKNLPNNVNIIQNNWLDGWNKEIDVLVSNPPYVLDKEVTGNLIYDPYIALVGNGIQYYEQIAEKKHLFKYIYLEICPRITHDLKKIFPNCIIKKDLAGLDRVLIYSNSF